MLFQILTRPQRALVSSKCQRCGGFPCLLTVCSYSIGEPTIFCYKSRIVQNSKFDRIFLFFYFLL